VLEFFRPFKLYNKVTAISASKTNTNSGRKGNGNE
jgi:hypothetical protein